MDAQARLAIYDVAFEAVHRDDENVSPHDQAAIRAFLRDTEAEDEWLRRTRFIDGSPALLMRSMLMEQGSELEQLMEKFLPRVRSALKRHVLLGVPVPRNLRFACEVSVTYWKTVAQWQQGMLPEYLIEDLKGRFPLRWA